MSGLELAPVAPSSTYAVVGLLGLCYACAVTWAIFAMRGSNASRYGYGDLSRPVAPVVGVLLGLQWVAVGGFALAARFF